MKGTSGGESEKGWTTRGGDLACAVLPVLVNSAVLALLVHKGMET